MHMKKTNFGNDEIFAMDWAAADRRSMLRALNSGPRPRAAPVGYSSGCGVDVGGADKRSVKAMLMGKGDLRSTWWRIFSRTYVALVRGATVEHAMYAFHKMHQTVTMFRLTYAQSVRCTAGEIESRGLLVALQNAGGNVNDPR